MRAAANVTAPASCWHRRAEELATWAIDRLANRLDAWGEYRPEHEIGREYVFNGEVRKLGEQKTVRGRLTVARMERHFRARDRADVVGLHTADADNQSKGGGLDIDHHGPESTAPAVNLKATLHWYGKLVSKGFRPLLLDSNDRGGFHLRPLLAEPIPADRLFWFLKDLTSDHKLLGFHSPPEQFPKQKDVRDCKKGLGNWLRVPGRHHKREHWSRIWDGERWLKGDDAIDFLLALQGDPGSLISDDIEWRARIGLYLNTKPTGKGEGSGRDDDAFNLAAFIVRDLKRPDAEAIRWLLEWDARQAAQKGEGRLREILRNAHDYGQRAYGSGLGNGKPAAQPQAPDYHLTDTGNAQRVADRHGEDLRFCHPWKQWQTWDGKRWAGDDTGEPARRVKETAAELYRSTTEALEALAEADASVRKAQAAPLQKILKHCLDWEESHKITATLEVLRSERGIPILPAQLDADPFLLNVLNGTLDLRTGTLRPHRREDYLTKICRVEYDPNATCPTWHKFLDRIIVSRAVIDYLHRVIGYCLTGDVREQALFFFHGAGANGKSTFLTAIREVLGDYAIQAVSELLLAKANESHPTERADLFGRRFVATIETDQGKAMAEALMKQLTGGDSIRARKMRQDFFEFNPTHKIILAANHKPAVRGTDHAVWRRIKLVPFTVTITDAEKDTTLPDKLRAEYPGILAWAVEGCRQWQAHGLGEPEEVRQATADYQAEQDTLALFVAECCHVHREARVKASLLLDEYAKWSGDRLMTPVKFGLAMKARGFEPKQSHGTRYYLGLMLHAPDEGAGTSGYRAP